MAAVPYLPDINIFLRLATRDHPQHRLIAGAVDRLIEQRAEICYTPQNIVEFWNVFTRPKDRNGFGMSPAEANAETALLESRFTLLPDDPRIHHAWRDLVASHSVSGVQVHDARLVAVMRVHGISHLLTLNPTDFLRYRAIIMIVHPTDIAGQ